MKKWHYFLIIGLIFLLGIGIRLIDITDHPFEIHGARQMRSALISRDLFEGGVDIFSTHGMIEPPIIESLSTGIYFLLGEEVVWLGRVFSILFWMFGAAALYDLSRRISNNFGAMVALVFYLFPTFTVLNSRTMMPDPMMTAGIIISIWSLYRWQKKRTRKWALAAGLITGVTILIKAYAGLILIVPFAIYILITNKPKEAIKDKNLWIIFALSALPVAAYFFYGLVIDGRMASQFDNRFFTSYAFDPGHYVRWFYVLDDLFSLPLILASMVSIAVHKDNKTKWLLTGTWIGYFLYGFFFPYHIRTHTYYHLPLVPIIAVSLAPLAGKVADLIEEQKKKAFSLILIILALGIFSSVNLIRSYFEMMKDDYREEAADWLAVEAVMSDQLNERMISVSADYNTRVTYYTHLKTSSWPLATDLAVMELSGDTPNFDNRWQETIEKFHYFLVFNPSELDKQPNLGDALSTYEVYYDGLGIIIYDLYSPIE